jgi:hypothetical protein
VRDRMVRVVEWGVTSEAALHGMKSEEGGCK